MSDVITDFNGTTLTAVNFNGTALTKVIFNGTTVFEKITTCSYQLTSFSYNKSASVTVTVTLDGTTSTYSYTAAMSSASEITFTSSGTMAVTYSSTDDTTELTVKKNGTAISSPGTAFSLSDGDSITITWYSSCLTGDTLITLADMSRKRIDELTYDDKILGINPDTLEYEAQELIYCDNEEDPKYKDEYTKFYLEDGTILSVVGMHRFFCPENQRFDSINRWILGQHAMNQDGKFIRLVKSELIPGKVRHYTLDTTYHNYFVNGILSGNKGSERLFIDYDEQEDNNND